MLSPTSCPQFLLNRSFGTIILIYIVGFQGRSQTLIPQEAMLFRNRYDVIPCYLIYLYPQYHMWSRRHMAALVKCYFQEKTILNETFLLQNSKLLQETSASFCLRMATGLALRVFKSIDNIPTNTILYMINMFTVSIKLSLIKLKSAHYEGCS